MSIYFEGSWDNDIKTYEIFAKIEKNDVGRVIIGAIRDSEKDLVFTPRDKVAVALDGRCNAEAHADKPLDGAPQGVSRRTNNFFAGHSDNPYTRDDERYDQMRLGVVGTGAGSAVHLYFGPEVYLKSNCHKYGPGSPTDEVLHHEMVHTLRFMQGLSNAVPTENPNYENEEEFLAILVTNVYISAKGSTNFRADHLSFKPLKPPLNTSSGFLADPDNMKLMVTHRIRWSGIFAALAKVTSAKFNPFREFVGAKP